MITFSRLLARQLRVVLRKSVWAAALRGARPPVVFDADREGLSIRACDPEVAVAYHQPGKHQPEVLALSAEVLDDAEGRGEDFITLEANGSGTIQARWDDAGVPQARDYDAKDSDSLPAFPELPKRWETLAPGFLQVLTDAAHTAARDNPRYAVHRTQLRGATGEVVATDGRELLIQGGFSFPWKEDLLIPSLAAFACREVSRDVPVAIGQTDTQVGLRIGPWTFLLAIDKDGRFPRTENVVPALTGTLTTCQLSPEDASFLGKALPRLPGGKDENAPLTLDLNGRLAVRVHGEGQPHPTEVVLSRSTVDGPAVRTVSNRQYLARAVQLGFTQLAVVKADVPVVCRDGHRTYVWMPLGKDGALAPSTDAVRILSHPDEKPTTQSTPERRKAAMPAPKTNGQGHLPVLQPEPGNDHPPPSGLGGLLQEAEALKEQLRDAFGRSTRLVAALKRHRQQSRQMASALASLRQLQQLPSLDS